MSKLNKKEREEAFHKMNKNAFNDLKQYAKKWHKYKHKEEDMNKWPFFLQLRDACHNILVTGACVHTLNEMIKDAKKEAVNFHKDLLNETKH
tara:strand:- start:665 stop:940 length:276 start_codon:yes stop_codon:yes gene_type:complete